MYRENPILKFEVDKSNVKNTKILSNKKNKIIITKLLHSKLMLSTLFMNIIIPNIDVLQLLKNL